MRLLQKATKVSSIITRNSTGYNGKETSYDVFKTLQLKIEKLDEILLKGDYYKKHYFQDLTPF